MLKFKSHSINEKLVPMGNPEWEKPNGSTGEARIDILKRLIQDKKPIELAKGGTFKVADPDAAIKVIDAYVKNDYKVGFFLKGEDGKLPTKFCPGPEANIQVPGGLHCPAGTTCHTSLNQYGSPCY